MTTLLVSRQTAYDDEYLLRRNPSEDSTTSLVESIWPLAGCPPRNESTPCGKGVLPLRTFIQETLRRSRTSYSTLQVALYYLILIKPHLPKRDLTMEQSKSSACSRAMQCGRRMFLAALILASKYLQDRNYSARAWSKISGLNTCEINANELNFLIAVNWKLHISETIFQKWTDIVLKYTPKDGGSSPMSLLSDSRSGNCWAAVVSRLTPELDNIDLDALEVAFPTSTENVYPSPPSSDERTPSPRLYDANDSPVSSPPREQVPTNATTVPRTLATPSKTAGFAYPSLPTVPRQTLLPTPQMTPQSTTVNTPAVSVGAFSSRRPSICSAMSQAQSACMQRTAFERCPPPMFNKPVTLDAFPTMRRSSLAQSTTSSTSSPESMVSDASSRSSRSSRSSSISSIASFTCAPSAQSARLAVQAPRRCAMAGRKIENNLQNITIVEQVPLDSYGSIYSSPASDVYNCPDVASMSLNTPTPQPTPSMTEAAQGLCQLSSGNGFSRRERDQHSPAQPRKRARPNSSSLSLQENVRELLSMSSDEGDVCTVLDADPFLSSSTTPVPLLSKSTSGRKRARCATDAAAKMLRRELSLHASPVT